MRTPEEKREYIRKWRARNPDKQYLTPDQRREHRRLLRLAFGSPKRTKPINKEVLKAHNKAYYANCRTDILEQKRKYFQFNKHAIYERRKKKLSTDFNFRMRHGLGSRMRHALKAKGSKKLCSTELLLGCTFDFLRGYIEARFTSDMTWNNYGSVWHVDHIIPCAEFDLTDYSQQLRCFNYSNLRPLLKEDNRSKSDHCPAFHQFEML